MKHFVLAILTFAVCPFLMAQDFNYTPSQHVSETIGLSQTSAASIAISTDTPEAIQYEWSLMISTIPTEWYSSLCDYGNCYIGIPGYGQMNPISKQDADNGVRGSFVLNVSTDSVPGSGKAVFYVNDINDFNRGDTVSLEINIVQTSAISDIHSMVQLYPNPANQTLNIRLQGYDLSSVQAYDLTGQLVAKGSRHLDVADLPNGTYLLRMTTTEGETAVTRFVKQ